MLSSLKVKFKIILDSRKLDDLKKKKEKKCSHKVKHVLNSCSVFPEELVGWLVGSHQDRTRFASIHGDFAP